MKLKSLDIGRLSIKNNLLVAPLAGFSDLAFRKVCYDLGAGLCFTEMVSAKGILYDNAETFELLKTSDSEYVKAVQLFGNDPDILARACVHEKLSPFDIVDINMGCPVPKVFNNGEGSALLNDPVLCEKIVSACVKTGKTVTVKMRLGVSKGEFSAMEVAKRVDGAGASLITVHARRREDYYSGEIDFAAVEKIVGSVNIPVIFNGNVFSDENAVAAMDKTGAAGVMLARAALSEPWLIAEMTGKREVDRKKIIKERVDLEFERFGDRAAVMLRKQMSFYLKNCRGAKALRIKAFSARTKSDLHEIIDSAQF